MGGRWVVYVRTWVIWMRALEPVGNREVGGWRVVKNESGSRDEGERGHKSPDRKLWLEWHTRENCSEMDGSARHCQKWLHWSQTAQNRFGLAEGRSWPGWLALARGWEDRGIW